MSMMKYLFILVFMKSTSVVQKVQSDKDTQFIEGWHLVLMGPGQVLQVNLEQKLIVG